MQRLDFDKKGKQYGSNVSFSQRHTKKVWKPNLQAKTLTIDGKKYELFTAKQGAWAKDAETDKTVAIALSKGKQAVIKAVSERNNASTDTYSLDGFGEALALIDKACNVKH